MYYACVRIAIAQILNGDIDFNIFIIINKMKQQITENKENLFFAIKNCVGVSSDLKKETTKW